MTFKFYHAMPQRLKGVEVMRGAMERNRLDVATKIEEIAGDLDVTIQMFDLFEEQVEKEDQIRDSYKCLMWGAEDRLRTHKEELETLFAEAWPGR